MDAKEEAERRGRVAGLFSYLERHRIYELFHEIITLLLIEKPIDHISYMKQSLCLAAKRRDTLRIILLSPPDFNKKLLANYLYEKLDIDVYCLQDIETEALDLTVPLKFAESVAGILQQQQFSQSGWLFIDFPRNKSEARAMQRIGILPTHVVEIVWTNKSDDNSARTSTLNSLPSIKPDPLKKSKRLQNYYSNVTGLREAYAAKLKKLETNNQTYEELGNAIINLTKNPHYAIPCIFRVLIIGSRGSGRRTLARYLSQRYGLVHVDFDYLLEQTRKLNSPLGEELRWLKRRWSTLPKSHTRIKVVENKLMSHECIKRGWILTGYPLTVEDFQQLNSLTTPPNRIIFLDVDQTTCRERLLSRRFNLLTGSEHFLPSIPTPSTHRQVFRGTDLMLQPKDYPNRIETDIAEYAENVDALLEYAGESVVVIDGDADEKTVCERVEASLINPVTCVVPSSKCWLSKLDEKIDFRDMEFDPDDGKPATKKSSSFYETDSELSLI